MGNINKTIEEKVEAKLHTAYFCSKCGQLNYFVSKEVGVGSATGDLFDDEKSLHQEANENAKEVLNRRLLNFERWQDQGSEQNMHIIHQCDFCGHCEPWDNSRSKVYPIVKFILRGCYIFLCISFVIHAILMEFVPVIISAILGVATQYLEKPIISIFHKRKQPAVAALPKKSHPACSPSYQMMLSRLRKNMEASGNIRPEEEIAFRELAVTLSLELVQVK